MSLVTSGQLEEGLVGLWDASSIDAVFQAVNADIAAGSYPVLNNGEATPGQPFPYCVFLTPAATTTVRMTGHDATEKHEIRDAPIEFRIHAQADATRSGKRVAADLAEEVIKVYGGHPTVSPGTMLLTNGVVLINQYQNDFSMRTDDGEWLHVINYLARLDVPMMV